MTSPEAPGRAPQSHPAAWRRSRGVAALTVALITLAVVAAVGLALTPGVGLSPLTAFFVPALVAVGALVAVQAFREPQGAGAVRASRPGESVTAGLALPYRRDVAVVWAVLVGLFLVMGVGLVLAGALVLVAAPRGDSGNAVIALLAGTGLVAFAARPAVALLRGRLKAGALILTPDGVLHRGWSFDVSVPWWAVTGVAATGALRRGIAVVCGPSGSALDLHRRTRAWGGPELRFLPDVVVDATNLAVDPVLALRVIELYVQHPELRAELSGPAALDRVRALAG